MLVFVDESAANERTKDRKYGWSPRGIPALETQILHHSKRWSILPAYTIDGYITTMIVQGSITRDIFNRWVREEVLPQCNLFPGFQSVLIMDNASIHQSQVSFRIYFIKLMLTCNNYRNFETCALLMVFFSASSLHIRLISILLNLRFIF